MSHDAKALANEIMWRGSRQHRSFTHLQIQKLIYYCHGWMLGIYDKPMIEQEIQAWEHGPVIEPLYRALKKHGSGPVRFIPGVRDEDFSPNESAVVDQVLRVYGHNSGVELSDMTHVEGSPWHQTIKDKGTKKGTVVDNSVIKETFQAKYRRHLERTGQQHALTGQTFAPQN